MALYLKVNVIVDMSYIELLVPGSFRFLISIDSILLGPESLYILDSICICGVSFPVPLQVQQVPLATQKSATSRFPPPFVSHSTRQTLGARHGLAASSGWSWPYFLINFICPMSELLDFPVVDWSTNPRLTYPPHGFNKTLLRETIG